MKLDGITINVGVALSEDTVQRCVALLNMYLTDNPNLTIEVCEAKDPDILHRYIYFVPKEENT